VITVGAANLFGTASRSDDAVTRFSSRGPTRGGYTFASGHRWVDNLIKPDLVAPGNRVVAMLGAEKNEAAPRPGTTWPAPTRS
jgi:serine protease AprX